MPSKLAPHAEERPGAAGTLLEARAIALQNRVCSGGLLRPTLYSPSLSFMQSTQYHCEKQAMQAVDRERLYAAAEVFFSPGGEIFPCCFPRGREKC